MVKHLPVIDLILGAKLLGGNQEAAKNMIKELAATLPEGLEDLQKAFKAQDVNKIGNIAHYIHGGACYCGTPRLKTAASSLERQARNQEPMQDLEGAYITLCKEILLVLENSTTF